MGKFNEYSQKATPEDADSLMIYDAAAKSNKLSPFSGIWNWIVGKLTNAVISNLQTNNKTVVGALNELNSKSLYTYTIPVDSYVDIKLPYANGCYILTVSHAFAGNNIYIIQGNFRSESIGIYPIKKDYEKFIVTVKGTGAFSISQKDTGGNSEVGLLRIC